MARDDLLHIYVRVPCKMIRLILDSQIKKEHLRFPGSTVTEISENGGRADKELLDCYLS